jgi:battenin
VISTWSSGTGGAGIVGAISYTVLRAIGLSNKQTLLVMIAVPILEAFIFFLLLRKPLSLAEQIANSEKKDQDEDQMESNVEPLVTFKEKILYIKHLLIYMIPLTLVYLFEYFINQGLVRIVIFCFFS